MKKMSKKKMMTGGMANTNAKAVASKVATGRSGGGNTAATAQNTATGKSSGGVNTVPTSAIPAAMYGRQMSKGGKVGKMSYGGKVSMKKMGKKK
jgi:hypothetical protein